MSNLNTSLLAAVIVTFGAGAVHAQDKKMPPGQEKKLPAPAPAPVPPPAPAAAPAPTAHVMIPPKSIKWGPPPPSLPPGAKFAVIEGDPKVAGALFTMRLKMPNGYMVPPHFHPAEEHVTVLSGNFSMGMGDAVDKKTAMSLPAGSFMIMPKGEHHYGFAKGETIVQVHAIGPWGITYVNPADDPRTKAAAAPPPAAVK